MSAQIDFEDTYTDDETETDEEEFDPNDDTTEENMLFPNIMCCSCAKVCPFCILLEVETEEHRNKFICHDCSKKCWKCCGIKGWELCKCDTLDEEEDEDE